MGKKKRNKELSATAEPFVPISKRTRSTLPLRPVTEEKEDVMPKVKPVPSVSYLLQASMQSFPVPAGHPPQKLLVLDLNNTLVCRKARQSKWSKAPAIRPFLSTFLTYLYTSPAYQVMVWSSSQPENVKAMSQAIGLLPLSISLEQPQKGQEPVDDERTKEYVLERSLASMSAEEKELHPKLAAVWARDRLNLAPTDYYRKVETIKDLAQVWKDVGDGRWNQSNTLLMDDSDKKAVSFIYLASSCRLLF